MLNKKYTDYNNALNVLKLDSLVERRKELCLNFVVKCLKNGKMSDIFQERENYHNMKTRQIQKFKVNFAHTEILKSSSVIFMQNLLNSKYSEDILK